MDTKKLEKITIGSVTIEPFLCSHSVTCLGYNIIENRGRKFLIDQVIAAGIAKEDYNKIIEGRPVFVNGKRMNSNNFLGPKRKGLKITYCTDTRSTDTILEAARGADLFVCEGMYPDERFMGHALKNKHMLAIEAAKLAQKANVGQLWLTHFSPIIACPRLDLQCAKEIFENTTVGYSGLCVELNFEKETK